MLEQKLDALTEAVKELTSTIKAGGLGGAKAAETGKTADAGKATSNKAAGSKAPARTADEAKAAAFKVRDAISPAAAQKLISDVGKAPKLGEVKPENFNALIEACEKAVADHEAAAAAAPADENDGL